MLNPDDWFRPLFAWHQLMLYYTPPWREGVKECHQVLREGGET
jgi:hypothetical protein